MIRTDLVPHPYFNVQSPDFYKQKKLEYELNRAKYKLVNQIRKGQEEATLQKTIDEIKRRNKALEDYTREQRVLSFVRDPNNPKVFTEKEQAGPAPARPVLRREAKPKAEPEPVEEEKAEPPPIKKGKRATKKPIVDEIMNKYGKFGLAEKNFININEKLTREFLDTLDRELDAIDGKEEKRAFIFQLLADKKTESRGMARVKKVEKMLPIAPTGEVKIAPPVEEKKPEAIALAEAVPVGGRPPIRKRRKGVSAEALTKSKRRLRKSKTKPKLKKASSAPLTETDVFKRALQARRRAIVSSESESEFNGDGISKKQKRILYRGSAMAGNNNKALLAKIMKI